MAESEFQNKTVCVTGAGRGQLFELIPFSYMTKNFFKELVNYWLYDFLNSVLK
jgi:hypothetical protein